MTEHLITQYLLALPEVTVDSPLGKDAEVFRVAHKMFALYSADSQGVMHVNLKCDPDEALILRDTYDAVIPGYQMNKRHWNTVILDGSIPTDELTRMIDNSYLLVVNALPTAELRAIKSRNAAAPVFTRAG
jgi:predicted DNA-binding protein (MmcQ/YjbR family)